MEDEMQGAQAPQAGPKQATPEQQKQFETLAKQAMSMLLSEQSTEMILAGARAKGGEQAIADAVVQVMKAALGAASAAGVSVGEDVVNAAAQPAVAMLVRAAEQAGLVKDGQAAMQQVMDQVAQLMGGDEAEAPGQMDSPEEEADERPTDGAGASPADREEF
jgi:hypothetical protein